jgi:polar amino acid transport system substrate-binding protein
VLTDPVVNTMLICTPHHLHAGLVLDGLRYGKRVFVEKPLALREEELEAIVRSYREAEAEGRAPFLLVGYNRRFAPLLMQLKEHVKSAHGPLVMHYRVNAGLVPPQHWIQDPAIGGGRILGEVCHFVDAMQFLTDALPCSVFASAVDQPDVSRPGRDNLSITLRFQDGSVGSILYTAFGDPALPKEHLEVFGDGCAGVLSDFAALELYRAGKKRTVKGAQDKGHAAEMETLVRAVRTGSASPIRFEDLVATSLVTFGIHRSLQTDAPVNIVVH